MLFEIIMLILSLGIILLSCELFTNGIEWLGKVLKFGDGVVGSIFSAVGTCLPETMIPVIALLFSGTSANSENIGIGAIVGAPFMLSTLAFFVTGISVLVFWKRRKTGFKMLVNKNILSRDIGFFIIVYSFSMVAALVDMKLFKVGIAFLLIAFYIFYITLTVKNDRSSHRELDDLYLGKLINCRPNLLIILMQIALALGGIIFGAELFVYNIEGVAMELGISALALSLIVTPIATELPEKFNSVIWISKKKDTLALGNITGAMVFQSCIPVSIGIFALPSWHLDTIALASAALALFSGLLTFLYIKLKGKLTPLPLLMGGAFYIVFITFLAARGFK